MYIGFVHTHVLVVILFLIFFIIKAVMLFLGKREQLARLRARTKVVDILLGTLILVTGGYLALAYGGSLPTWLLVKIVLVFIAIPLGIVGIARANKILAALSLLIFLYVYGVAETKSLTMKPGGTQAQTIDPATAATSPGSHSLPDGQVVFRNNCLACHGEDGRKGVLGAANLSQSTLTLDQRITVITHGRGAMPTFRTQLSSDQIKAAAEYIATLRK